MSFIVEYESDSELFKETIQDVPEMVLEYEALHYTPEGSAYFVFWGYGGNFERFEERLPADPTIAEFTQLTQVGDQRLYRVTFTEEGMRALTYPIATKLDIAFLDIKLSREGSRIRARVPSRDALFDYREARDEKDIPFRLNRIYREDTTREVGSRSRYGVSDAQREALLVTLERGYFNIPRETTLDDVADDLRISTQALSTRLRRGLTNLIGNTLSTESG